MYHTIYKITNLTNNKIYVGKHSCENLEDNYMGSGKWLNRAIKKYGIENFKKEILHIFDTPDEAYRKEKELVNDEFIRRKDVYNLIMGGDCFESINSNIELRKEKNRRAAMTMHKITWQDEKFVERKRISIIEQNKRLHKEGILKSPDWTGRKHREETKRKIGDKNAISQIGEKNSQYGTCWIYHIEFGNKKIKNEDLENYLKNDWIKGRKIKKN